jgi:hypothetical protein
MKFPCLVRPKFCKTPVYITLYGEGLNEDGAPEIIGAVMCNYQDSSKTVLTDQQKRVEVSGVILIPYDLYPNTPTISGGYVEVNGVKREIAKGTKARNPDGTVNYTRLDLI